ncbi:conserved hypothetical protein [Histoplasma capsulatum var. duboisii H88]|uniref:Yeast-phase specific protein yps-3 n=1 Tax=Ajellomyces capsulatus (strain H88) TaxID=544711 RepID=F0UC50_AJEC8|nr:conserved hypothetical protein [Histoplasma capsulatum var. duboisii H88]QSS50154.1 yeast-phase specific protein yps-3 [Histoplasma capsulatum var. duboisii H88]
MLNIKSISTLLLLASSSLLVAARPGEYPTDKYPTDKYPTDKYPTDKYPTDKYPTDKYPTDKYPTDKYPTDKYPTDKYPTDKYPTDKYPTDKYPTDKYPVDDKHPIDKYPTHKKPKPQPAPVCGTCNPISGQNHCDITTSCINTGKRFHCACRAGYKASKDNDNINKQFRLPFKNFEYLVFTPESTECKILCDDNTKPANELCQEVPLYQQCEA